MQEEIFLNSHIFTILLKTKKKDWGLMSVHKIINASRLEKDLKRRSEILSSALRADPEQEESHILLRELGETQRQLGDIDAALFYLEQAWERKPDSWEILISLGAVYASKKQFSQALSLYSRAYEIEGKPHILALMADALRSLERYKEAEVYVRTALRLQTEEEGLFSSYILGKILCSLEEYSEAIKAFKMAEKAQNLTTVSQWIAFAEERLKLQSS